ncbi:MAG: DivIVA domain-containing protein [Nocardioides sp.]|uniref:DivIVA domain-containing protein n=1 Tax=Nocardioides sp. TaxID=35761 RepID=UPI0039E47E1D
MMWLFAILIVLALGGVALVAAGVGSPLREEYGDRPDVFVPADRPLGSADLRRVRFNVTLRGYRMSEVDALLARLATEAEHIEQVSRFAASSADPELDRDGQHEGQHEGQHDGQDVQELQDAQAVEEEQEPGKDIGQAPDPGQASDSGPGSATDG